MNSCESTRCMDTLKIFTHLGSRIIFSREEHRIPMRFFLANGPNWIRIGPFFMFTRRILNLIVLLFWLITLLMINPSYHILLLVQIMYVHVYIFCK